MTLITAIKKSTPPRPPGLGASANLRYQLPMIGATFPEITNAYPGTINLQLRQGLIVAAFDHQTPPIKWQQNQSAPEVFDLLRIQLEVRGTPHDGWLYVAHGSPHRGDLQSHEIITPTKIARFINLSPT